MRSKFTTLITFISTLVISITILAGSAAAVPIRGQTYRDQYVQGSPKDLIEVRESNGTYDYLDYGMAISYKAATPYVVAVAAIMTVPVLLITLIGLNVCGSMCRVCKRVEPGHTTFTTSLTIAFAVVALGIAGSTGAQMFYHTALNDDLFGTHSTSVIERALNVLDEAREMMAELKAPLQTTLDTLPDTVTAVDGAVTDIETQLSTLEPALVILNDFETSFPVTWSGGDCTHCQDLQDAATAMQATLDAVAPQDDFQTLVEQSTALFLDSAASLETSITDVLTQLTDANQTLTDAEDDATEIIDEVRYYNTKAYPSIMGFLSLGLLVGVLYVTSLFFVSKIPMHAARYTSVLVFLGVWVTLTLALAGVLLMVDGCRLSYHEEARITSLERTDDISKVIRACKEDLPISDTFNITGELTMVDQIATPVFGAAPTFDDLRALLEIVFTNATIGHEAPPYDPLVAAEVDARNADRVAALAALTTTEETVADLLVSASTLNDSLRTFKETVDTVLDTRCTEMYEAVSEVRDAACVNVIQDLLDVALSTLATGLLMMVAVIGSFWVLQNLLWESLCIRTPLVRRLPSVDIAVVRIPFRRLR